ncbi:MAG TPA: glycosyltransferase family 2 protein [Bauldia sp.]|nr:glycosyltransferase family 2 protein [Bauldia sp.]
MFSVNRLQREADGGIAVAAEGDEAATYAARARRLGLPFVPSVDLGAGATADLAAIAAARAARATSGHWYIAPDEDAVATSLHWLSRFPSARGRLCVATPTAIRAALIKAASPELMRAAVSGLADRHPHLSARRVATTPQLVAAASLVGALGVFAAMAPFAVVALLNLIGAIFFFGVSALRFVAAGRVRRRLPIDDARPEAVSDDALPVYSVLVPLHGEAQMIPGLVAALDAIDWPRDRLDVKLVLEESDRTTIAAARRLAPRAHLEIVVVPKGGPQTKPKALNYALPLARGEFVTVYDAEDRPHPRQLREAHATFLAAGPDVACLQAGLVIDNGDRGWLPLLFSIEYAALFDGLLPALASLKMPLPLGGTSNHFRRAALEAVGGWDPYNVTEDADLGLRLSRFGYRCATLDMATLENAPIRLLPWVRQRTRWFKGWLQTWLVHTRDPVRLWRELGPRGTLGFALVGTGLIVSSLVYPLHLITILVALTNPLWLWGDGGIVAAMLVGANIFNLIAGYFAMAVLSDRALRLRGRGREARGLALLPLYWLLMSVASYRAILDLVRRPHYWAKTPH